MLKTDVVLQIIFPYLNKYFMARHAKDYIEFGMYCTSALIHFSLVSFRSSGGLKKVFQRQESH